MRKIIKSVACVCALWCAGIAIPVYAQGEHIITMQEADIRAFIDDVSTVTGKTFLVDPRVAGNVTISSEEGLTPNEVFEVFKNVLRVHGYVLTRISGNSYRVTLIQGAAQDAPLVQNYGVSGEFATAIFKTQYTDAAEAARLIKPVLHSQGVLTANAGGNVLVVTDYPENLRKARAVIDAMDMNSRVMETVQLQNISPSEASTALQVLAGPQAKFKAVPIPGTNNIVIEGMPVDVAPIRALLAQMDSDTTSVRRRGPVSVLPLRYANGADLSELLINLLPAYIKEGEPVPTVAYDANSNAVVISGSEVVQSALEGVIRQLDVRRPQVLVEAIIVEISDTAAKSLGVQFALSGVDGTGIPFAGTNFSEQTTNVLTLAGALGGNDLGLDTTTQSELQIAALNSLLGTNGGILGGAGISGNTLFSGIINALKSDADSNVLSTPFVTTLDNVPAEFIVGQEIPITTGESLGADNINPFRTFERKEVGIKLNVLPQISEGDVIRLEIKQEVSSIAGAITSVSSDFVTNLREINTTVLADNGEIIVLGGLLEDDEQVTVESIPILGDAPIIGPLFRSKDRSREKTNLMVFLRPTIIRTAADARPLTQGRLDYMRQQDISQSGRAASKIDEMLTKLPNTP